MAASRCSESSATRTIATEWIDSPCIIPLLGRGIFFVSKFNISKIVVQRYDILFAVNESSFDFFPKFPNDLRRHSEGLPKEGRTSSNYELQITHY